MLRIVIEFAIFFFGVHEIPARREEHSLRLYAVFAISN